MFRSRITLEEYLKSVQHEDVAGEDVSLDNIDMIPGFKEEVEHVGENIFESRVSINMNPSLINIPDDFKDDKEEKEHQREPGPLEWFMETHQDKEGSYHEPATKKFVMAASEVVFSEATVPAETFAYHKLMGPESSGRVRGVEYGVTSNQLIAKRNCQSGTEPSDSSIGDDVEENQRNNTSLTGEPIRDTSIPVPTLAKNNEASHQRQCARGKKNIQPNALQGVNKSYTTQIGKKHTIVTNRMENSTSGMLRPHNLVNQVSPYFVHINITL
ncbi:hypothetical protein Cgig2_033888 [Carnegiea gigantea]|uniref:Uncharacterized protein n=1 Tax=Carnegiea gigantea TaxID=171969 RepID=A0A9Q1JL39_9CARY|nr:hypothetical protein Cgig2_033888 [Carnegiea gigantea]